LIRFALPLLIGNLFQQLYNTVDSWVVGNYVSDQAFSAVGVVVPIINMLIGFFLGFSTGAGVVISQYYGAKQYEKVSEAVHTSVALTLILSVVFTVFGVIVAPMMLQLMNTPNEVIPDATLYLRIYFAGITGMLMYNIGAGILRAVGDSQRPFFYLVVSAVINIVLDLLFVLVFKMGVEGVAFATIIAQGVSSILVIMALLRQNNCCKLSLKKLKIDLSMLNKISKIGFPTAFQNALTNFSNVFVQSYINYFGETCMSGWTAFNKIDQFVTLPSQSIALASTTFVGQNLGKNQVDRAKKGVKSGLYLSLVVTGALIALTLLFSKPLVWFFNKNTDVVAIGARLLLLILPFHFFSCTNQVFAGALRGAGDSRTPMIIMLSSFVAFRQIYLFIVSRVYNVIDLIALGYPLGWLVCCIVMIIYYKCSNWENKRII
ncbi:MAG: MATE family efflux transporter, partial [Firmicutes bacterium]|nr:MATE family efflux transporter [Bacillota bacterium]